MDNENARTVEAGCWDGLNDVGGSVEAFKTPNPDFTVPEWFSGFLVDAGFGKDVDASARQFWKQRLEDNYQGDEGRARMHMASICLRDRDGLHSRIPMLKCPVRWMHGTADAVYSVANAEYEIKLFTSDAQLQVVQGGQHFLSYSHPEEVAQTLLAFVK